MPINWDEFDSQLDSAVDASAEATDDKLASRISSMTRMTDDEVKALFPQPADVQKLAELMKIVKSSEDRNNKINSIVSNGEKFGGIVLTLLEKFT